MASIKVAFPVSTEQSSVQMQAPFPVGSVLMDPVPANTDSSALRYLGVERPSVTQLLVGSARWLTPMVCGNAANLPRASHPEGQSPSDMTALELSLAPFFSSGMST